MKPLALAAFVIGLLIGASAYAADKPITGTPAIPTHYGVNNYAFWVDGQWYVVDQHVSVDPKTGQIPLGALGQALKVELAARWQAQISFLADCDVQIVFHTGAAGCRAHDID
jgi:hypothetical protein